MILRGVAILLFLFASPVAAQECVGDRNCDRSVTVEEITSLVNSALSGGWDYECGACPQGGIAVPCVVMAINNSLEGCPREVCLGDCDGDGRVTEDEILACLPGLIPVEMPPCCDANGDGQATTDEVVAMQYNSIAGCRP